jgi:DNA-binding beta-propeller fold protein YncE
MRKLPTIACLALLAAALLAPSAFAQKKPAPMWPHVSVAPTYKVDPTWPQRPKDFVWGHVPGVAVDAKDNVYVFTRAKPPVQVYSAKGKLLRSWGADTIASAHHIKIDHEGNVWISDVVNHTVEKYTPEGKLLLTIGTKGEAGRDKTHLNKPTDMVIDPRTGDVFVSDGYGNARVVHFDKNGKYINEWGELGHGPGQFSIVHAIVMDSKGNLYVADRNNVRIQVFDQKGKLLAIWNDLITPWGFAITKNDEIWVCGSSPMQWRETDNALGCPPKDQVFMKFNTDGKLLKMFTLPKGLDGLERPGEVNWVHAIAVDSQGNLYMGDIIGRRAQKFVVVPPDVVKK